jgi:hypothetical protein
MGKRKFVWSKLLVGKVGSAAMQLQYWTDNCIVQGCTYIYLFHKCIHSVIVIVGGSHIEYRDVYTHFINI